MHEHFMNNQPTFTCVMYWILLLKDLLWVIFVIYITFNGCNVYEYIFFIY